MFPLKLGKTYEKDILRYFHSTNVIIYVINNNINH